MKETLKIYLHNKLFCLEPKGYISQSEYNQILINANGLEKFQKYIELEKHFKEKCENIPKDIHGNHRKHRKNNYKKRYYDKITELGFDFCSNIINELETQRGLKESKPFILDIQYYSKKKRNDCLNNVLMYASLNHTNSDLLDCDFRVYLRKQISLIRYNLHI